MLQRRRKVGPKSAKKTAISDSSQHFPPFLLSPPCLQPRQTPFSYTNRWRRNLPKNLNPHRWQNDHCDRRSSPLVDFLLLLSSCCSHRQPPSLPLLAPRCHSRQPDHRHARCALSLLPLLLPLLRCLYSLSEQYT